MTRTGLSIAGAAAFVLAAAPTAWQVPARAQTVAPAAPLSADDQGLVSEAAAYLDGFTELKGRFVQTDSRGAITTGVLYLKRPGLARFAYDPPSDMLVVSDGRNVTVTQARLKSSDRYPLSYTPLSLVLAKHVRLDQGVEVTKVEHVDDGFTLTARDSGHRSRGFVTLTFHTHPMRLADWAMTDAEGQTTRIKLTSLTPTSGLDPSLFVAAGGGRDLGPPPAGQ